MTKVFFCPVPERSFYIQLLRRGLGDRYEPVFREQGGLRLAVEHLEAGLPVLLHIHWEEFFLLGAADAAEAEARVAQVQADLSAFVARGGRVVLTVHNGLPHRSPYVDAFLAIRRTVARIADLILVHNRCSARVLREQTGLDGAELEAKLRLLPHPAYTGLYEPADLVQAAVEAAVPEPLVLGFGAMPKQKGFGRLLETLTQEFTAANGARIRLSGEGREGPRLQARYRDRPDIDWDLRFVPQAEVGPLFRRAACLVLPYERFLTSGVALLAMTLGGLVVARDAPQLREILPAAAHRFLYRHDDPADLRRAVAEALALAPAESRALRRAGLAAVADLTPERIGAELGHHYDRLLAQTRAPRPEHAAALERMDWTGPDAAGTRPEAEPVTGSWPAHDTVSRNWGDKLNPLLIALMSGQRVLNAERMQNDGTAPIHLVIGSGLSGASPRHAVWGSGFIRRDAPIPAPGAVHAVRGPLSRDRLCAAGVACPAVYGDPALLLPLFYRPPIAARYDLGLIQHFRDAAAGEPLPAVTDGLRVRVIDILGPLTDVVDAILSCRSIASSSLHGLIAAHAYGVPATWIKFGNNPKGDDFKFRDYWASVGWPDAQPLWVGARSSCADLVGPLTRTTPLVDIPALLAACPFVDPDRKAALLRRAAAVLPAMPAVAFLAAALPDPALTRVPVEPERWSDDEPLITVLMTAAEADADALPRSLAAIRDGAAGARVEIVLSDLGMEDREARAALARRFGCQILHPESGTWNRAQGLNAAAAAARGRHLLVLGAGHAVGPRSLVTLRAYLEALPEAVHLAVPDPAAAPPPDAPASLACATDLFDAVGGFDTQATDSLIADFLRRARTKGYPLNRIAHPDLRFPRCGSEGSRGVEAAECAIGHTDPAFPEAGIEPNLPAARPRLRMPLVSVVIVPGRAPLLGAAIHSVLAQTMPDLEVVVVDDGAHAETAAAVMAIADPRLRLIRVAAPVGRAQAHNQGVRAAAGQYVAVQDADALMLPDRLERQLAALQAGDVGSYGGVVAARPETAGGETLYRPGSTGFALGPQLFGPAPLAHGTLLIRRAVCLNHPYDPRIARGSEDELVVRLAAAGYALRHCGRYLIVRPEAADLPATAPPADGRVAAAFLNLMPPEAEAFLRAAAEAVSPAAIMQPELDNALLAVLGPAYGISTDGLTFSTDLFETLHAAGVPFGVEIGKAGAGIEPRGFVLDQADSVSYRPLLGEADVRAGPPSRRPRVRAASLDSRFTERYCADNRSRVPTEPPSAAAIAFLRSVGGHATVLRFAGHWPGFAALNLPLDTAETALVWFEGDGGWQLLMQPCDPVELGVRLAVASHRRPGTSLHRLGVVFGVEEPA